MKKQYVNPSMMLIDISEEIKTDNITASPTGDGIVEDLGGDLPA